MAAPAGYTQSPSGFYFFTDGSGPYILQPSGLMLLAGGGGVASAVGAAGNSSITPLGIGGVFTGASENVMGYAEARVYVFAAQDSAVDGLQIQQSSNGVNWDIVDSYSISANAGKTIGIGISGQFFRVVYTNGGVAQGSFRLLTTYHASRTKPSSVRPQDARSNENDFEEILAHGMKYNGLTWDRERTPNVFIPLNAVSVAAEAPIWTPAAGKRFRLMGAILTSGTVGGNVLLKDGTGLATVAVLPFGAAAATINLSDLGNGLLSGAVNRVLTATGIATQTLSGTLFGVEE